jgi:predicted TPR repeat methyltransferase
MALPAVASADATDDYPIANRMLKTTCTVDHYLPLLQQWEYPPAQKEVIAALTARGARQVADIACGTGILADRITRELHREEVYGVDMSGGMRAQARARALQDLITIGVKP